MTTDVYGRLHAGVSQRTGLFTLTAHRRLSDALLLTPMLVMVAALAKLPEAVLPISSDTGMYATYGRLVLDGATPYVGFWDVHPPLVFFYWALVDGLGGADWVRTIATAHVLDGALTVAAGLFTSAIARRLGSSMGVAAVAAVLMVSFANLSMLSQEGSNPTKLALLPSTIAVWAYVRSNADSRTAWRWAVLAGIGGGLAMLCKQPAALTLIGLGGHAAWNAPTGAHARCRSMRLLALVGGAAAVLGVSAGYLAWIGALGAFVEQTLTYNIARLLLGYWHSAEGLRAPSIRLDRVVQEAAAALVLMSFVGTLGVAFKPDHRLQRVLLWITAANLVAVAGFREFDQIVPSLSILAAVGIGRLWSAAGRDGFELGQSAVGRLALVAIFGTVVALSSSFQVTEIQRAWFERGPKSSPAATELLAVHVRQDVQPGTLFIWGNGGQLYELSGREPASRFLNAEALRIGAPGYARDRAELLTQLARHPAAAIVVAPHTDQPDLRLADFPDFSGLISSCYSVVPLEAEAARDWSLYVRRPGLPSCGLT